MKRKRSIPFDFVLEELSDVRFMTKPMFGCVAIYVGQEIKIILRDRTDFPNDNGIWLATTVEHHVSLKQSFPAMRSIEIFGLGPTGWQLIPKDASDFEEMAFLVCELVRKGDVRIGMVPQKKLRKTKKIPSKTRPKKSVKTSRKTR